MTGKKDWQNRYKREKDKLVYLEFEDWSREDLIDHILQLRAGLDEMGEITKNDGSGTAKEFAEGDYKQTWSYPTKIAFLLTLNKKPLTSEELEKLLRKHDTHFKDYTKPRNNLTVTLNRTVKSGRIKKIKVPGIRSLYYALPEWLDKDSNLMPTFSLALNPFK
ncbi:MAG: hypothetical protein JNL60_13590 [Bacteroidia bacterium]|nr:hypothetical protein [Bacteroidia bacterium]